MSADRLACDVLVVGAGPAGSAVAAALAAAGRDVLLVESRAHPRPKACAEYASPRIVEELVRLRLPDADWRPDAMPLRGMRVMRDGAAADIRYADDDGPRHAWGVQRTSLDAALARHAGRRGARLVEHVSFVAPRLRRGRVRGAELRTSAGRLDVDCRWLIGADGARSRVARTLGLERPPRPRRLGLVAHYEGVPELAASGEMHVGDGYYVGLAPLAGGRLNVGMALPYEGPDVAHRRPAWHGAGDSPAALRFEAAIAGLPAVAERLRGRARLTPIRGASPIGHRVSRAAGRGWLLVGDAAGFIDPFTGEGIYRALRSARAAAEALAPGDGGAERRYLAARRRAFTAKDALTWVVQALLDRPPLMDRALRRLHVRDELAVRLGSALGDCRPASDALSPAFVARVFGP